jgi:hypothetical protein
MGPERLGQKVAQAKNEGGKGRDKRKAFRFFENDSNYLSKPF